MTDNKPIIPIDHVEIPLGQIPGAKEGNPINLEQIFGNLHQVTTTPTWTPKTFKDSLAVNTSTSALYYYDFLNKAWKTVGGTSAITGYGTMSGGILDITDSRITSASVGIALRKGTADSSSFPQLAGDYLSGTTFRFFEGSFTKTWTIYYAIYP